MSKNFTKEQVKKAIAGSGGIISTIATRLRCDWHTADAYIEKHDLQQELSNESESILDMTEGMLIQNIQDGDPASIFFMLKTKGKKRGYVERQEIAADVKVTQEMTDEERNARIAELERKMREG